MSANDEGYRVALEEARSSLAEGGIPVGSAIVSAAGEVLGRGRNMRVQNGSPILHGETAAFDSNRALPTSGWRGATIYTTLSPCPMCAGAMVWFGVAKVVIGENVNMSGREELLRSHGIDVVVLDDEETKKMMGRFAREEEAKWKGV